MKNRIIKVFLSLIIATLLFECIVGAEKLSAYDYYTKVMSVTEEYATEYFPDVVFTVGKKEIVTGDKTVVLDTAPAVIADRAYLPVRALAETLGADVSYDSSTKMITLTYDNVCAKIKVDDDMASLDFGGKYDNYSVIMSARAVIDENNRCLAPIRSLAEDVLGCEVDWDNETKTITVRRKFQTKRLLVKTKDDDYSFAEYAPAECFCDSANVYVLQFGIDTPDVVLRKIYMGLSSSADFEYVEADEIIISDF